MACASLSAAARCAVATACCCYSCSRRSAAASSYARCCSDYARALKEPSSFANLVACDEAEATSCSFCVSCNCKPWSLDSAFPSRNASFYSNSAIILAKSLFCDSLCSYATRRSSKRAWSLSASCREAASSARAFSVRACSANCCACTTSSLAAAAARSCPANAAS